MRLDDIKKFINLVNKSDLIELDGEDVGVVKTTTGYQAIGGYKNTDIKFKNIKLIEFDNGSAKVTTELGCYVFKFFRKENLINKDTGEDRIMEH